MCVFTYKHEHIHALKKNLEVHFLINDLKLCYFLVYIPNLLAVLKFLVPY